MSDVKQAIRLLREKAEVLKQTAELLEQLDGGGKATASASAPAKRVFSAAVRAKMAKAQQARWRVIKGTKKTA